MIGLGLSLCGACVMADADVGSGKPMYDASTTRGYFISASTKIPQTQSGGSYFDTTINGQEKDIEMRGVCASTKMIELSESIISLFWLMLGDVAIWNCYVLKNGNTKEVCFQRANDASRRMAISHFGTMDCSIKSGVASAIVSLENDVLTREFSFPQDRIGTFTARQFIAKRANLAPDAVFNMSYTRHLGAYVQLVYPLAEITGATEVAAIDVMNKTIMEL